VTGLGAGFGCDNAACFWGGGVGCEGLVACCWLAEDCAAADGDCAAAGGEPPDAVVENRSNESDVSGLDVAGGSGAFSATSSGVTISTEIGSAVTEPNGWTSVKKITSIRNDKWASADAVMPERKICRVSTVLDQRFDAVPARQQHSSIPFRCETEIGQPPLGASHPGDLGHLLIG
jgi:hypothetical protein